MPLNPEAESSIKVNIEYCGVCDYGGHCLKLANLIKSNTPDADILCKQGRQGSFEIFINDKLVYSKLRTMALPDYEEVTKLVKEVDQGGEIKEVKGQQPIDCCIA